MCWILKLHARRCLNHLRFPDPPTDNVPCRGTRTHILFIYTSTWMRYLMTFFAGRRQCELHIRRQTASDILHRQATWIVGEGQIVVRGRYIQAGSSSIHATILDPCVHQIWRSQTSDQMTVNEVWIILRDPPSIGSKEVLGEKIGMCSNW